MKFVSWNVNGLRAIVKKGFKEIFDEFSADFFCVQEIKLQEGQINLDLPGYHMYWNYAERKGYSGTAIFTKHKPLAVKNGIDMPEHDTEGRAITLEYDDFYLVTVYTPNSQDGLKRIDYRCQWEQDFQAYLAKLSETKAVIVCGDLNVAHEEIDLANPASNHKNPGFSDQEREQFSKFLGRGFVDSFRYFKPEEKDAYSWWSYRMRARERNVGWRIDYFVLSEAAVARLKSAEIHADVYGSDHCPVSIVWE